MRLKFQDQLRKSFVGYISIVIAAMLLLMICAFVINFVTSVVISSANSSRMLAESFEDQCVSYNQALESFSTAPEILSAVDAERASAAVDANRALYDFTNAQSLKAYFILLNEDGQTICSNFNRSNQESFSLSAFASGALSRMDKTPEENLGFVCTAPLTSEQACSYSLCRAITGGDKNRKAYLFFNLRESGLREKARTVSQEVLITDRYDNVIYTTLDLEEDPMDKLPSGKYVLNVESKGLVNLNDGYYYVSASTDPEQRLRFCALAPLSMRVRTMWYSLALFLLLLLVMAAIVKWLTRAFTRQNTREIAELTQAVVALGAGSEDYHLPEQCSEESAALYSQFKALTLRLRESIRHNSALLERRRQMEVKQLEEQFNPHFVFNIMETIRYQMGEDTHAASEMLQSFANLLRYSINSGHNKVLLESDVEYVNDYLLLQKVRYNNCLSYEFQIPDELSECLVPKLLLQPIIENSIKHGFVKGQVLEITVEAQQVGDNIRFTVRDNGAGIEPNRLRAIKESFDLEINDPVITHIGIYNVHKVLGLLYGTDYGVDIDSEPGKGTVVTLCIPYETEAETC